MRLPGGQLEDAEMLELESIELHQHLFTRNQVDARLCVVAHPTGRSTERFAPLSLDRSNGAEI